MDEWKSDDFSPASVPSSSSQPLSTRSNSDSRQKGESEGDPIAARKVQKADREKLRRDRLNEHFYELGNTLDPERPKNDKATILNDSIQVLKDLAAEVSRLKTEYAVLSEESRELTNEKNELREEKASLKSEIETLSNECQQKSRVVYPWGSMDPSVMMGGPPPGPYPYPIPGSIPYPYFGPQSLRQFVPYVAPPIAEHPAAAELPHSRKEINLTNNKSSEKNNDRSANEVATDLELKTPGSSLQKDLNSLGNKKGKQLLRKESDDSDECFTSSRYSSQVFRETPSYSVGDVPKT